MEVSNWMSERPDHKAIRIERDAWLKLKKATAEYDLRVDELLNWIILELDQDKLNDFAKDLDSKLEIEEDKEAREEKGRREKEEKEDEEDEELEEEEDEEEGEEVKKY